MRAERAARDGIGLLPRMPDNPTSSEGMSGPEGLSSDQRALRDYALSLPGTYEDFPWGDWVAKVGTKVFGLYI